MTAPNAKRAESPEIVRAAGGIVTRGAGAGAREILVVHRPDHDDWSLPKGKLDEGEDWDDAAAREVREETGIVVRATRFVASTHYLDARQRPKEVRYFEMETVAIEPFIPNHEVDQARWCRVEEVAELLSYDTDRSVVEAWRLGTDRRPAG